MNIGRHNYEEYFILYMDNELNPAERGMVESFVQLHPDLKEELDLLMQFKLDPDESVVFHAKDELLKKENAPVVNEANFNDWLLLYVDNELTGSEKLLVDQFILSNPVAQKEWNLLQQAKLQPELVSFAGKSSLYRTEKVRRMPVRWRSIAAAAILLIAIGLTTAIIVSRKPGVEKEIVKANPVEIPEANKPVQVREVVADNNILEEQKPALQEINKVNTGLVQKPTVPVENKKIDLVIPEDKNEVVAREQFPTNNLPKPSDDIYSQPKNIPNAIVEANPSNNLKLKDPLDVTNGSSSPYIKYASNNPETDDAGLDQPEEKKTKLRGFFRKVARTFEKRTNIAATDDENKVLVAGLAFKLK